jgi:hypothetical protein
MLTPVHHPLSSLDFPDESFPLRCIYDKSSKETPRSVTFPTPILALYRYQPPLRCPELVIMGSAPTPSASLGTLVNIQARRQAQFDQLASLRAYYQVSILLHLIFHLSLTLTYSQLIYGRPMHERPYLTLPKVHLQQPHYHLKPVLTYHNHLVLLLSLHVAKPA